MYVHRCVAHVYVWRMWHVSYIPSDITEDFHPHNGTDEKHNLGLALHTIAKYKCETNQNLID